MLQQTRVAAVIPYYEKFLQRFPDVRALANARVESVVRLWAGLGYYSRARNIHSAAKEIIAHHKGQFPKSLESALTLPGIGRYTAAAVLSIAYGAPHAVLDGNVARVLARLGALRGDLRAPKRWSELERAAATLLPPSAAGEWNEAMMELGATVCTPRAPQCGACPVAKSCRAFALGIADQLPAARIKRAKERVTLAAAVLLDPQGRTLLVRPSSEEAATEASALFSRLWQFPAVVAAHEASIELAAELRKLWQANHPAVKFEMLPLSNARHTVTFREIALAPYLARVSELPVPDGVASRIVPLTAVHEFGISSATRKIAAAALAFKC